MKRTRPQLSMMRDALHWRKIKYEMMPLVISARDKMVDEDLFERTSTKSDEFDSDKTKMRIVWIQFK